MTGTDITAGDVIEALDGCDTIDARGGSDVVVGRPSDDGVWTVLPSTTTPTTTRRTPPWTGTHPVKGGPGSDDLHAFGGDDLLAGGAGGDRIFAGKDRFDPRKPVVPTESPGKTP